MPELAVQRSASASQSSIPPVAPAPAPRPSRSSVSQSSLLRRKSESSPALAPVALPAPQTSTSAIPSFRAIRNLLPFAPAKLSNTPSPGPANAPRPSIVSFGTLRRMGHDRKTTSRPQEEDQTPIIAIARPSETFEEEMMARKRSRDVNRSASDPSPSQTAPREEQYVLPLPPPVEPLGADLSTIIEAENSGISKHLPNVSDTSLAEDTPTSPFNLDQIDKGKTLLPSPDSRTPSVFDLSTSKLDTEVMHALKVEDATSANEWLQGLNGVVVEEEADADRELVPLFRTPCDAPPADEHPDPSLDFGALDPDLAELLSPNRVRGKSQLPTPIPSRIPSRNHSRSPSHPVSSSSFCTLNGDATPPRISPPRLGVTIPPPASRPVVQSTPSRRTVSLSRTNPTRGASSSLPRLMRSVINTPPGHERADSSPETSTPARLQNLPKKRHQPPSPLSSQSLSSQQGPPSASSRGSSDLPLPRRPAGSRLATPIRHVSSYASGNSRSADPPPTRLPPQSEKLSSSPSPRSASDPAAATDVSHPREPTSRPSLEFVEPLDVNRRRRPHLFYNRRRSMSVEETRLSPTSGSTSPIRPSSSLSNRPPAMEWLGPRTAKAFAAAGLLDGDREGLNAHVHAPAHAHGLVSSASVASGVSSRYATLRAHTSVEREREREREERFVPSRMAFSEAASTSSWGRSGSASRGVTTPSEAGGGSGGTYTWGGSPTFSVPRTTFSGSTAPTSVSAATTTSSSQQQQIQLMKEKHDLETEALLGALSDSQRTSKTLREENVQLRERIRELEDELDEMRMQIHRIASTAASAGVRAPIPSSQPQPLAPPPPISVSSYSTRSKSPRDVERSLKVPSPSPLAGARRIPGQRPFQYTPAHMNGHGHRGNGFASAEDLSVGMQLSTRSASSRTASPCRDDNNSPVAGLAAPRPRRRRASTTSSVFPSVPPNMSMLMLEETMQALDRSSFAVGGVGGGGGGPLSMPPSPVIVPHGRHTNANGHHRHHHRVSTSGTRSVNGIHNDHNHNSMNGNVSINGNPNPNVSSTSPTIASFSMTEIPGSPSSLQLRPEHELHLGDMASLSLYDVAMSDDENDVVVDDDL